MLKKQIIRLTERDLTRLIIKIIKEEEESSPQISSISVMNNMITPSGMDGKNGVRLKYDGKNVATKCEGFMLK